MHAERDALARIAFPELRHRFRPFGIDLAEIDLRWGITAEAATDARVLPICLSEIDQCRPYFIGILGERYGWVDPSAAQTLERSFPHLAPYFDRSATELEIRHAILDAPPKGQVIEGFFYLNDSGGRNVAESGQARLREAVLSAIPDRCRSYASAEALAREVVADLDQSIRRSFVVDGGPDRSEMARQELIAAHTQAAVQRSEVLEQLRASLRTPGARLLLYGPQGAGKTTLIAQYCSNPEAGERDSASHSFASRIRRRIETFLSAGAAGPSPRVFVCARTALGRAVDWRTPMQELVDWLAPGSATGLSADKLLDRARSLVADAARTTPVVIVIDGLDDFAPEQATSMPWLQVLLLRRVSLLTSCREPRVRALLERMLFRTIEVPVFAAVESERACIDYFRRFGKELAAPQVARLASGPASSNPGLLRLKQEELRLFGNFDQLDTEIARLADMAGTEDVVEGIVNRVRSDRTLRACAACSDLLGCIAVVRTGLSDDELRRILSELGHPVDQPGLSEILYNVAPLIAVREGSITVRTAEIRGSLKAYVSDNVIDALNRHFLRYPGEWRSLVELPALLVGRGLWQELALYLASPDVLRGMSRHAPDDLMTCARLCERESRGSLLLALKRAVEASRDEQAGWDTRKRVARLLVDLGHPEDALLALDNEDGAGLGDPCDIEALQITVLALRAQDRGIEAIDAIERCHGSVDKKTMFSHWVAAEQLLVDLLIEVGRFSDALSHARCLTEAVLVKKDQQLAYAVKNTLAQALLLNGSLEESAALFQEAADHADLIGDLGAQHAALGNLGVIARRRKRPREALRLHAAEEEICRSMGDMHALQVSLGNQALAWLEIGNLDQASRLLDTKLGIATEIDDMRGRRDALAAQSIVFDALGQTAVAARLREAAEALQADRQPRMSR